MSGNPRRRPEARSPEEFARGHDLTGAEYDEVVAACAAVEMTGADHWKIAESGGRWHGTLFFTGARIITEDHPSALAAVRALFTRAINGSVCCRCGGMVVVDPDAPIFPRGRSVAVLSDGSTRTRAEAESAPRCRWWRADIRWYTGCTNTPVSMWGRFLGLPR